MALYWFSNPGKGLTPVYPYCHNQTIYMIPKTLAIYTLNGTCFEYNGCGLIWLILIRT